MIDNKGQVLERKEAVLELVEKRQQLWAQQQVNSHQVKSLQVFENRICLTISETAYALGLSPKTVERLVKKGKLLSKRVGRRVLIFRSGIEAWLNQKE